MADSHDADHYLGDDSANREPASVNRPPHILFFADAGARIGGGHVMRCLTLAGALARLGAVCAFAETPEARDMLARFVGAEIARVRVAASPNAVADAARTWGADGLVLDHYGAGADGEAALRAAAPLLVMDDLKRSHSCDLVLDSNLGAKAADYPGIETLAGPAFALIRPDFTDLREAALARLAVGGDAARILVSLGLTDVGGITGRVARALVPVLGARAMDVVVGAGASSLPDLRALAAADARISLHIDTAEMAALTARADLAVGAGGSSAWERACLGLATLTVVLADNQRANTRALAEAGATVWLDAAEAGFESRLADETAGLLNDDAVRRMLGAASAGLCDGLGAERVARGFLALCHKKSARPGESRGPGPPSADAL